MNRWTSPTNGHTLTKEEFRILKDRLYRAGNALELACKSLPALAEVSILLEDGHPLRLQEIVCWLNAVRSEIWKVGPPDVQQRHIQSLIVKQPNG